MNARELVSGAWRDVVRGHHCNDVASDQVLKSLLHGYAQPQRHYHTLDHIADLLRLLDEHGPASDRDAVKLAILFHDAVYDPTRQDNEAASAELAVDQLTGLGFPDPLIIKVERYILATRHDAPLPDTPEADLLLLLDLDLSVLAAPPDLYRAYAQAIRQEYAAVPENLYRLGRRRVLEAFLGRERIYCIDRLSTLWEGTARSNLASELAGLGS